MPRYQPGTSLRFTYLHKAIDEQTGDKFKEVFALSEWDGHLHALDLKRLTPAEREVLTAIMDPATKTRQHRIPLVNDIVRRMDPVEDIKEPLSFYNKFVKQFVRDKDVYRRYDLRRMLNVTTSKPTEVVGHQTNAKPLFHRVESKPQQPAPTKPAQPSDRLALLKQRHAAWKKQHGI